MGSQQFLFVTKVDVAVLRNGFVSVASQPVSTPPTPARISCIPADLNLYLVSSSSRTSSSSLQCPTTTVAFAIIRNANNCPWVRCIPLERKIFIKIMSSYTRDQLARRIILEENQAFYFQHVLSFYQLATGESGVTLRS